MSQYFVNFTESVKRSDKNIKKVLCFVVEYGMI